MKNSENAVENFEYELDKLIGSDKLQKGFKSIVEKFVPSNASLEFLIEKKIFESEVFKELSLFPKPKQRQLIDHKTIEINKQMFQSRS